MEDNLSDNDNMIQTQVDEETNVNDSDDNEVYNDVSEGGWIQWFCALEGNEFFVEIEEEFLRNRWNLYGLNKKVKNYKVLIDLILSPDSPSEEILTEEFMESVSQAKELYGLLHSRFITTSRGLALVREKYLNGVFGHCPRILCDKQILLPVGLSEEMKYSRVKTYPDLNPKINPQKQFIPKIYGFKIFGKKGSKYYDYVKNARKQIKDARNPDSNTKAIKDPAQVDDIIRSLNKLSI